MKRYDLDSDAGSCVVERPDGEYILYADHVEAMKRIAGEGKAEAELTDAAKEAVNVAIELITVHYGHGWSTHVNVLRDLLEGPSFAQATPAPSASPEKP